MKDYDDPTSPRLRAISAAALVAIADECGIEIWRVDRPVDEHRREVGIEIIGRPAVQWPALEMALWNRIEEVADVVNPL